MSSEGKDIADLTEEQKARFIGTMWNHGCIRLKTAGRKRPSNYFPTINIMMKSPLLYEYKKDVGGNFYKTEKGYYILELTKHNLVKKRLEELKGNIGGMEEDLIDIALDILSLKRGGKRISKNSRLKMVELYEKWKMITGELIKWCKDYEIPEEISEDDYPIGLWTRAHFIEEINSKQ